MRRVLPLILAAALTSPAFASTYPDSLGDNAFGGGILDITSMEVTNTATDISFKFNLGGDPVATNWGKYMVAIDRIAGGDPASNGWVRPIGMPSGMDIWLGGWADSGNGLENRGWTGAAWNLNGATYLATPGMSFTKDATSVTETVLLADLGLSFFDVFFFDAFTSGGGATDGAIDSAANPLQTIGNWGDPYNVQDALIYTVTPEPITLGLLGFGALSLLRRRRA